MIRSISIEQACAMYVHRFTMEFVPYWSRHTQDGQFYAPQYRTDREWYENTTFPGEGHIEKHDRHCECRNQSWPLGQWLREPYIKA